MAWVGGAILGPTVTAVSAKLMSTPAKPSPIVTPVLLGFLGAFLVPVIGGGLLTNYVCSKGE